MLAKDIDFNVDIVVPINSKTKNSKKEKHNYIAELLNSQKILINNDVEEKEFFKFLKELNINTEKGYLSLMIKKNKTQRWSLDINEIEQLEKVQGVQDFYCTLNTLYCQGRHTDKYINKLNAFYVDLDYYNIPELQGLTATQVVGILEQELDYPEPTFYVDSGRGLYIIWLLQNTYATQASKKYWKKIEKLLIELFQPYGSDPKASNVGRVFRLIGSKNSKSGKVVKLIQSPNYYNNYNNSAEIKRYEMFEIAEFFWGIQEKELFVDDILQQKEEKKPKKRKTTTKITQLKNTYTLNCFRCDDLETLVELRKNNNCYETGYRENLLFLYRLHLLYTKIEPTIALEKVLALNNKLPLPLDIKEVTKATENAEKIGQRYIELTNSYKEDIGMSLNQFLSSNGAYIFKNDTIIKYLNITPEEQYYLRTIIGPEEKNNRRICQNQEYYSKNSDKIKKERNKKYKQELKEEGKQSRDQKNKKLRKEIKKLINEGKTQKEIANILGLGIATIKRHIKAIKENNL